MSRYNKVLAYLDGISPDSRSLTYVCGAEACACMGCRRDLIVDSKPVSDYELEIYQNGEMKRIVEDDR